MMVLAGWEEICVTYAMAPTLICIDAILRRISPSAAAKLSSCNDANVQKGGGGRELRLLGPYVRVIVRS